MLVVCVAYFARVRYVTSMLGGVLERRGDQGGTRGGGGVSSNRASNWRGIQIKNELHHGLKVAAGQLKHTTTNQKNAGLTKEVEEGSCDWQGKRRGERDSIVWVQLSLE